MKKKFLCLLICVALLPLLAYAAASQETPASAVPAADAIPKPAGFPTKTITCINPGAAGGSSNIGWRTLQPFLEKEMGVSVVIEDIPGGGGWVAWGALSNRAPDGYTVGGVHVPAFPNGYLNPNIAQQTGVNFDSYSYIATSVSDLGIILVRSDDKRFPDVKSFIDYALKNDLSAGTPGNGTDDHIAIAKINYGYKTKLIPVHLGADPEGIAALLGGHIDAYFGNVSLYVNSGNPDMKALAVMGETRSSFLPNVPTLKEAGYNVINGSSRGITGPKGINPEIVKYWEAVLAKVARNPEYQEKMKAMGFEVYYTDAEGFKKTIKTEEEMIVKMADLLK
jgi:tripartite-type tricarboxylate transporter receptor subunit TctC